MRLSCFVMVKAAISQSRRLWCRGSSLWFINCMYRMYRNRWHLYYLQRQNKSNMFTTNKNTKKTCWFSKLLIKDYCRSYRYRYWCRTFRKRCLRCCYKIRNTEIQIICIRKDTRIARYAVHQILFCIAIIFKNALQIISNEIEEEENICTLNSIEKNK